MLLTSCAIPKYTHEYRTSKGMNFTKGRWLVNYVDAPWSSREYLTKTLLKKLSKLAVDSIAYIADVGGKSLLQANIPFSVDSATLRNIKTYTNFDYLINVRAREIKDDLSDIMISSPEGYSESEANCQIVIYDINKGTKAYSQKVTGSVVLNEKDDNFRFAKSAENLMIGSLNKALKDLKKYSYYK